MFNPKTVAALTVADEQNEVGQGYPAIAWINGDPAHKKSQSIEYFGGFFLDEKSGIPQPAGWEKTSISRIDRNTKLPVDIPGFWARSADFCLVGMRRRWLVGDPQRSFPDNAWKQASAVGSPVGHIQIICLIRGCMTPVMLTFKGHAGMSFEGHKKYASHGVLNNFNATVVSAFDAAMRPGSDPKSYIPPSFRIAWCPIRAAVESDGSPHFVPVGQTGKSHIITPPAIGAIKMPVDLNQLYVGDDVYAAANDLYKSLYQWLHAWDVSQGEVATAATPGAPSVDAIAAEMDL